MTGPVTVTLAAPRLAVRKSEAAELLGLSDESFDRYVRPFVPTVRLGTLRLYPVAAIALFLEEHADTPIADDLGGGR